ncbi:adenosine deaminase [Rarobacter incanus]|uniref:Adenosine deaminase n=1 Tax=Rarobacter incanus TaxID=153494 RepID=A0A542SQW7_9MICO|nr:adenosine deaminase [Rarobacter incanus]TQK77019.1 adenosine deaminase [Rarobacter incanus]
MANDPERDLNALPKAHLHLHFTGSMLPETLRDLAAKHSVRLPSALLTGNPLRVPADQRGWFRFQRLYDAARNCVRDESDMRRLVDEAIETDAQEGSGRLEFQVDPTSYAARLGGITPTLEIVLDQARASARAHNVDVGVIVAASRMRHPLDARTLARLAARHAGDGPGEVMGFGLSNDERSGATAQFGPAFAIAARAGLLLVPHGGELLGPAHIRQVIASLHPDRLGHGVRAAEDLTLLDDIVRRGIALEVCPQSNVSLGVYRDAAHVPLRTLVAAGANVALGADDPLLFGSRLTAQYEVLRRAGWSDAELAALARSSVQASAAATDVKARLYDGIDAWLREPGSLPPIAPAGDRAAPAAARH